MRLKGIKISRQLQFSLGVILLFVLILGDLPGRRPRACGRPTRTCTTTRPVIDGIQALAALREDEATRLIPVAALTASAMKGSREEILAYGFDGYISKPIDAEYLLNTVKRMIHVD